MARNPLWTSTVPYDAHTLRVADAMMIMTDGTARGARQGTRPGPALTVSIAGTTLTVNTGNAAIAAAAGEGIYLAELDTAWTGTINAADATYTRIDLVYLRVWDADLDGTGLRQTGVVYLPGTPSGTPSAPSIPAGQFGVALATVTVPPSGGGAASVNSTVRPYTVAPGGILPVTTAADLAAAGFYAGQARYNTTRNVVEYWSGSAWSAPGDWSTYTPTWTSSGTQPIAGNGVFNGRWCRLGKTINLQLFVQFGSTSNAGTGEWAFSLPVAAANIGSNAAWMGSAVGVNPGNAYWPGQSKIDSNASVVKALSATSAAGSTGAQWGTGVPYTWTNGHWLNLSITYEAAS